MMKRRIHFGSGLLLQMGLAMAMLLSVSAYGQTGRSMIHLDKGYYVTGETIWYSVHLPDFFEGNDRVIRVTVVEDNGRTAGAFHLRTGGKTTLAGYYKIPYEKPTGVYRLFFHGVSRYIGQNLDLAEVRVPIYNDFEKVSTELDQGSVAMHEQAAPSALNVNIELDEPSVDGPAEAVIAITDASGQPVEADFSISITDTELNPGGILVMGPSVEYRAVQALQTELVVKGNLFDKQGTPLQVNVLGAYSPEVQRVVYSKSDANGKFHVNLPDFNGDRRVQFLGYSVEVEDFDVEVPEEFAPGKIDDQVVYTQEVLDYLDLSRKRKKIYQYFTSIEHNLEPEPIEMDVQELEYDFRYDIEEYQDFDFVYSFFGELITPLKFQLRDSTYSAKLENPRGRTTEETHLRGAPLFIVDGKATRNADFVARIDLGLVKYVDLYYDPYKLRRYFNAVGRSGVINITTKVPDLEFPAEEFADIFVVNGLQPHAEFPQIREADEGLPRIMPQLYWDGAVETDYDGTATIRFRHSEDRSGFKVEVVAQDKSGARGVGAATYSPVQ